MLALNCVPTHICWTGSPLGTYIYMHVYLQYRIYKSLGQRLLQGREINSMGLGRERPFYLYHLPRLKACILWSCRESPVSALYTPQYVSRPSWILCINRALISWILIQQMTQIQCELQQAAHTVQYYPLNSLAIDPESTVSLHWTQQVVCTFQYLTHYLLYNHQQVIPRKKNMVPYL